jgi:hypothetical protein
MEDTQPNGGLNREHKTVHKEGNGTVCYCRTQCHWSWTPSFVTKKIGISWNMEVEVTVLRGKHPNPPGLCLLSQQGATGEDSVEPLSSAGQPPSRLPTEWVGRERIWDTHNLRYR